MKNIKIIAIIVIDVLLFGSCSKDFIKVQPISTVTTDVLYQTDKNFNDATIGSYRLLQDPYDDFWQFGDLRADDCGNYAPINPSFNRVDDFVMDVNDDVLENTWSGFYRVIYSVNMILSKIEDKDPSVITNMDQYIGEAKFVRALAYFDLVRIFGAVPMLTNPITIEEASVAGRDNVDDIYKTLIIPDLLDAENKLPVSYSGSDIGRATKGAATSLLGKVYLTQHDFENAEKEFQKVTTMGYALLANFNDLFTYKEEHHSEYIFDIEYIDGGLDLGSEFTTDFMMENQTAGIGVVSTLQKQYGIEVINSRSAGSPELKFIDAFEKGDLRKDVTASTGVTDDNGNFIPMESGGAPSFTRKYMTSLKIENDSKANWKVIRYADVLLMYAEALNENGKTSEALNYLNKVRERAGLAGYTNLSQSDAREKIYQERRFELYLEGKRWFDLVRTGRAYEVMKSKGMKPYMTVFPIPQRQIEVVNDPSIFPQNEGY